MKTCNGCSIPKSLDSYYVRKNGKPRSRCKDCELSASKSYFKTATGKAAAKRANVKIKQERPELMMLWNAKASAKKLGRVFDLRVEDIEIPLKCPVLGIPLFWTPDQRTDNTPSLDRIDSNLGYVKGNILVVSWRANKLKSNATVDELGKMWRFYRALAS